MSRDKGVAFVGLLASGSLVLHSVIGNSFQVIQVNSSYSLIFYFF
jgi:hypothetical protein